MSSTRHPSNGKGRSRYYEHDRTSKPLNSQRDGRFQDHKQSSKNMSFKAVNHGNYYSHRNWNNESGLFSAESISEFSHRTRNRCSSVISSNKRSYPERDYSNGSHRNIKQPPWTIRESSTGWYCILVSNVIKDCDEVFKILQTSVAPLVCCPYNKQYFNGVFKFLIDDFKVAKRLHNTCPKRTLRYDRKLTIKIFPYLPTLRVISLSPVPNEIREKMMEVLPTRYDPNTKSFDLSHFHVCSLFTENQLFVPLNQPAILLVALSIVYQCTKNDIYGLNLDYNNIYLSEGLVWIRRLFPKLKILNLARNKLSNLIDLKCLSGFTVEVLNLSNNPFCDMYDSEYYKQKVQELFPLLKKLDDFELPIRYSSICTESKMRMPVYHGNNYPTPEGHDPDQPNPVAILVESFLSQYYERYDNIESKKMIAEAYHPNATYSMSSCLTSNSEGNLYEYLSESRNLLKFDKKKVLSNRLIHKGRTNIANVLELLPNSKHDLGSFIVDVPLANTAMIQIIVNGVFAETNYRSHVFRSFCRTFVIVPVGSGWSIFNDMLFVTVASDELILESSKRFHKLKPNRVSMKDNHLNVNNDTNESISMEGLEMSNKMEVVTSVDKQSSTSSDQKPLHEQIISSSHHSLSPTVSNNKLNMIKNFSNESGMNEKWAQKCLEDNNWDYAKSAWCFSRLLESIPEEAFIK